jgi:acyl carrier protein
MTKREQVREFLTGLLESKDDPGPIGDDESLVLSGRLSSLDVVETLTFLESRFGYSMDPNEFDQAHFDSVDSIMALLSRPAP